MTNFEVIKELTLEQLATKLCNLYQDADDCHKCPVAEYCRSGRTGFIPWLKEEAKEDA